MKPATAVVTALVTLGSIAALVVLLVKGVDTSPLLLLVTPILGTLFVAGKMDGQASTLADQNSALARITAQTNGVLDDRIKNGVRAVLAERDRLS